MNLVRSLNIEHVSLAQLIRQEISRSSPLGQSLQRSSVAGQSPAQETILALMRRWFWTRKPDAGFALGGFPATLLQAQVFDEWLDARDESLNGVFADRPISASTEAVADHYRLHGLLLEDMDSTP